MHAKVIIIGSGPAGYTAAIYAARAMLEPVMIQGLQPGGQLTITTDVENYPGFADVIQGPWLMDQMKAQAEHVGTKIVNDIIVEVDFDQRPFVLTGDSGDIYTADSADHRHRRPGASGWACRVGAEVPGLWRLRLRHLRRLLLSQQGSAGGRRRQHRGRGSAVPHQFRLQGHRRASPRRVPRRAHPAGAPVQEPQDRSALEHRDRRGRRLGHAALGQWRDAARHRPATAPTSSRSTASSSPSATRRRPRSSPASST